MKIMFWSFVQRIELFIQGKQWKSIRDLKERVTDTDPLRRMYFERQRKNERANIMIVVGASLAATLIAAVVYIVK